MSGGQPRWERPVPSIEELIQAVRRESAAALTTARAFLPGASSGRMLNVPRRFPVPDRPAEDTHPEPAAAPAQPPEPDRIR